MTSVTRESRCPVITYMRSGAVSPRRVAMQFVITVGVGIRGAGGWTKDCFSTVIRPPEAAAKPCI
jgi:hypothetical protein